MRKDTNLVLLSGTLVACGGRNFGGGGGTEIIVNFNVDPAIEPQCYGTDDITTFKGSFLTSVDCV